MGMRDMRLWCVLAVAMLAGCSEPGRPTPRPSSSPFDLYTHCGIVEAKIDGRWYAANPPQSDGNANPPAGWGDPYQNGTITFRSSTQAEFSDAAGHHVLFSLRPDATGPPRICS
jgi:hypothetical protein